MTYPGSSEQCGVCRHFQQDYAVDETGPLRRVYGICTAYPKGIPTAIWNLTLDHRQPLPGDHAIQFAPLPGKRHPHDR